MNFLDVMKPLPGNVGALYMAANTHLFWSHAQSQLPHLRPPPPPWSPSPSHCPLPANILFIYISSNHI
jgi:hypothetical protein